MLTLVWIWIVVFVLLIFLSAIRLVSWLVPVLWCFPLILLVILVVLASRVKVNKSLFVTELDKDKAKKMYLAKPMGFRIDPRLYDFTSGLRRPRRK